MTETTDETMAANAPAAKGKADARMTAEIERRQRLGDPVADLGRRIALARIDE